MTTILRDRGAFRLQLLHAHYIAPLSIVPVTAVVKRHRLDVMARATVGIVCASGPVVLCSHSICRTVAFAPANIAATITMTPAAMKSRATFLSARTPATG